MLNLIRIETTRIFKSKSSLYIVLAMVLSFGLMIGLVHYTTKNMDQAQTGLKAEETVDDSTTSIDVKLNEEKMDDSGEDFVISDFPKQLPYIFDSFLVSLFYRSLHPWFCQKLFGDYQKQNFLHCINLPSRLLIYSSYLCTRSSYTYPGKSTYK